MVKLKKNFPRGWLRIFFSPKTLHIVAYVSLQKFNEIHFKNANFFLLMLCQEIPFLKSIAASKQ